MLLPIVNKHILPWNRPYHTIPGEKKESKNKSRRGCIDGAYFAFMFSDIMFSQLDRHLGRLQKFPYIY